MIAELQIDAGQRIGVLRERCMERKRRAWRDQAIVSARSLRESEGVPSWPLRLAMRTRDRLAGIVFDVDDMELLVGRLAERPAAVTDRAIDEAGGYMDRYPRCGGQTGHCELDYGSALCAGLGAVRAGIIGKQSACDPAQADVYASFLLALDGLQSMIAHGAAAAERTLLSATGARAAELRRMAAACRRVVSDPPATFREALQLLWFIELGVWHADDAGLVVPGHLDRALRYFYEADIAAGRLTSEDALVLIEQLYLLINEYCPDGLAVSVMVGGRDADGRDVSSDLSRLCLEALRRTRLVYPTVGLCWHEGTPGDLVDLAVELVGQGYANPAFFSDDVIQAGLRRMGLPPAETCCYINSTCVEISPSGGSNVWVASPYYNLCGLLLETLAAEGAAPSFDALVAAFRLRAAGAIRAGVAEQNALRERRAAVGGKPLQSVFTRDCVARGRDIDCGGARYNWVECSFVGLANLADALHVIEREVFVDRRLGLRELVAILAANFEGHEDVRQRFLHGHAKYGQGCDGVDRRVGELVEFLRGECALHRMAPDASPYVPGAFVWQMHEVLGRETGATPDGRRAGMPFADGCGPAQGREKAGPTAAILSTTSWDHSAMIGGLAYNMKFSPTLFRDGTGYARLKDLVLTFLRRGGFETQINVVDHAVLTRARSQPEMYRDLVVRIGGYTDYFTRLSPEMQEELILRTEFERV